MNDSFKIYLDRLKDGHTESIDMELSAQALSLEELEGKWSSPIQLKGKAYCVDAHLVLSLNIDAQVELLCKVCNQPVKKKIQIKNHSHTELLADHPCAVFNGALLVKELLFVELPTYIECGEGGCMQQEQIGRFLTKEAQKGEKGYYPFKNLSE